jgi:large subunit ribosomal protein L6e
MAKVRQPATDVARGINKLGRSATYKRRGLFKIKEKNGGKWPVHAKAAKPADAKAKAPKFYPAEDAPRPLHKKKTQQKKSLRASITPGTVLILLAGRFKGKRVVFLKQLDSGLLLVTGPYAVNGVPARRVNAAYVIATSTRVSVEGVNTDVYTDKFFAKPGKDRSKSKSAEEFFAAPAGEKKALPAGYLAAQAALDGALAAKLDEATKGYLAARFTLRSGDKPHAMAF